MDNLTQVVEVTKTVMSTGFIIVLITGLTQVIKKVGLPSRYVPILSVGLGVIILCSLLGFSVVYAWAGVLAGLSASGLYDVGAKTLGIKKEEVEAA